jgi:subtilisin family serine protease
MKRVFVFAVLALTSIAFASEVIETNEYIVKTHNIPALESFVAEHNLTIEPLITYPNPSQEVLDYTRGSYVVSFGTVEQEVADSLVGVLETLEGMQYVEPNSVIQIEPDTFSSEAQPFNMPDTSFTEPYTPNDPLYDQQWNAVITKTNWAWNLSTGQDVKVGIIDLGIDTDHEDLEPNINFDLSYNFKDNNTNIEDGDGHGTLVSGIAGAKIDNNKGIAGIAGNCSICMLKGGNSGISLSAEVNAIYFAADNNIPIINMSFGDYSSYQSEKDAINDAWEKDVFLCAGAGNDNKNASGFYPCAYEHVMGVGGSTSSDSRWPDSNYGSAVEVYAPGKDIPTTRNDGTYSTGAYGTSMATPHVAGLAALIWDVHPDWTNQDVWDKIINSADTITIDKGKVLRINAMKALDIDSVGVTEQPETPTLISAVQIQSGSILLNYSAPTSTPYTLNVYDVTGRGVHNQSGQLAGCGQITYNPMSMSEGVYFWRIATNAGEESGKFVWVR